MSESLTHSPAKMLNVKEVAVILACSARHVRRLSDSGAMPRPRRLGMLIRWSQAELDLWIAAGCPSCRAAKGGAR